jgi:hypothetical protein
VTLTDIYAAHALAFPNNADWRVVWKPGYVQRALDGGDPNALTDLGKALWWINPDTDLLSVGALLLYGPSALATFWDGKPFPPVIVDTSGEYGVLDGWHRVMAATILQLNSIPARKIPGSVWYAGLNYISPWDQGGATTYPIV